jgi:hypothetical protein
MASGIVPAELPIVRGRTVRRANFGWIAPHHALFTSVALFSAAATSAAQPALATSSASVELQTVAKMEVTLPARSPFVLHGTLPIPKGVYPTDGARSPFAIVSHDAAHSLVPVQVEIVSRYPTGEADVIEITARVERDAQEQPGTQAAYSVVLRARDAGGDPAVPEAGAELAVTPRVRQLLARDQRGRFGLRTRDVYGNAYWAELTGNAEDPSFGSLRLVKSGPVVRTRRVYATMVPIPHDKPLGPPLAHMMGVHAYITERAEDDCVSLDLRLNNGAIAGSRDVHDLEITLGIVYWRSVELVIPSGWSAVSQVGDPFLGTPYDEPGVRVIPIVRPYPDGKLHMMGPQAQFERRLALVPDALPGAQPEAQPGGQPGGGLGARARRQALGPEARAKEELSNAGLAFCMRAEGLWSWFDPRTARYFPQRDLLASVDFFKRNGKSGKAAVRAMEAGELAEYRQAIETGGVHGYYVTTPVMGWAHPWFVKEQGSPGGEGIAMFEGYYAAAAAARDGVSRLELLHRMNVSRQPEAAYDRFGDPVGYHQWLRADGRIPFDFRTNGGIFMPPFLLPCKRGPAASDQVRFVVAHDLRPPYDIGQPYLPEEKGGSVLDRSENLLAWWPHDDQHMVRYTKNTKALVWLANDALAKDDLVLSAELYHLMKHESPHVEASWSHGVTLKVWEDVVKKHPHQGVLLGREDAWGIDAMCAAYSVTDPAWRAANRAWFDRMSQLMLDASMSNGMIQRFINIRLLGNTKYAVMQTFEALFLMHAIRCMNESVFRGVDEPRRHATEDLVVRGLDYLMWGRPWQRGPNSWQPDPAHPTLFLNGPRQGIAVALNDDYATPPFCDAGHWGPNYMPEDGFGSGIEIFHVWLPLDYAQEITNETAGSGLENRYLRRTIDCGMGHKDWHDLVRDLHEQTSSSSFDNSANWIGLLGKLQCLGVR